MLSAVWYNTSAGQLPVEPEQLSAGSHTPADWRHVVVEDLKPSTQVLAPPRQESVASQGPPLEVPTQAVVDGWMNSSGHCANIMNGSLHVIGVGYGKRTGSTYTHYWTQDFGGG